MVSDLFSSTSSVAAACRGAVQKLQQVSRRRQIGIKLQHTKRESASLAELSRLAVSTRDVQANFAFGGRALECISPELHRALQIAGLGFDHPEIRGSIYQSRILGECPLVKLAGMLGRSPALFGISQRRKKGRIVRRLFHCL